MAPKRKSDAIDLPSVAVLKEDGHASHAPISAVAEEQPAAKSLLPPAKKRKSDAMKADDKPSAKTWQDIKIEGEDEGDVAIYDDCNEIRRKIRALQKEPGFKITHWLKEIGNINTNSYGRFMKKTGAGGGAENGIYEAAYLYFEKKRILEGKKKTPTRIRNEQNFPNGFPRRDSNRPVWVFMPA